ncbi:unnamed protein product [Caenorhabditis auriculariae]|uniref:Uncharacterized protein n=1 Tax=Caenorhabditis auriculariae TaxID=2777116 RepID=A0A8S1GWC3_9PELO|nr:unnamed protein product [Caenorhabditis auriculariae]
MALDALHNCNRRSRSPYQASGASPDATLTFSFEIDETDRSAVFCPTRRFLRGRRQPRTPKPRVAHHEPVSGLVH